MLSLCFPLCLVARFGRKIDQLCAYLLGGLLAFVATVNESNFDHQNYVGHIHTMVDMIGVGFIGQMQLSKDPLFPLIVDVAHLIANDYVTATFAIIAFASALLKVLATSLFPGRRTVFMAFYIVFLSPLFEFEAIRASLALSFVLCALLATRWPTRLILWILALSSHASVLVAWSGLIRGVKLDAKTLAMSFLGLIVLAAACYSALPRIQDYTANYGTLNAFALPSVTLIGLLLGYGEVDAAYGNRARFLNVLYWSATISTIFSLLICSAMVTVAFRVLAVAWVLYMFFFFLRKQNRSKEWFLARFASIGIICVAMSYAAVRNGTWQILLSGWR